MGVKAEVKEIRKMNKSKEGERRMVVAKLRNKEENKEVMRKKLLKEKRERKDDWTKKERMI